MKAVISYTFDASDITKQSILSSLLSNPHSAFTGCCFGEKTRGGFASFVEEEATDAEKDNSEAGESSIPAEAPVTTEINVDASPDTSNSINTTRSINPSDYVLDVDKWAALKYVVETKRVPGAAIKKEVDQMKADLLADPARESKRLTRAEKTSLKEAAIAKLLPKAFSSYQQALVVLNFEKGVVYVITQSKKPDLAEDSISALRRLLGSFKNELRLIGLNLSAILTSEVNYSVENTEKMALDFCSFSGVAKIKDSSGGSASIKHQPDALSAGIAAGAQVFEAGFSTDNISFLLDADMNISSIKLLNQSPDRNNEEDQQADINQANNNESSYTNPKLTNLAADIFILISEAEMVTSSIISFVRNDTSSAPIVGVSAA